FVGSRRSARRPGVRSSRRRSAARPCPRARTSASSSRRRTATGRYGGRPPTSTTSFGRSEPTLRSASGRTTARATTSPVCRCESRSRGCSSGCPGSGSTPTGRRPSPGGSSAHRGSCTSSGTHDLDRRGRRVAAGRERRRLPGRRDGDRPREGGRGVVRRRDLVHACGVPTLGRMGRGSFDPLSVPRLAVRPRDRLGYYYAPMSTASELPSLRLDAGREQALERAAAIVARAWQSFDRARPGQPDVDERLHTLLRAALPGDGSSVIAALDDAAQLLDVSIAQPRPRFFAFVGSSGLEIGVLGDLLASCFDVNLAVWAGAASEVEDQAVRWVSEFVGFPAAAGAFTSGGTISNVTALAAARERALPGSRREGMTGARAALYCSQEAHYSVVRAAELLGVGSDHVRSLEIDDART